MQDPRGLSGAVLQREPMRDFAKDYAFGEERRAQQAAQRQKRVGDEMSQFDFNFKSSDHKGWYTQNILQPLKERMTAYAEAKASGDMETARTLDGEINQLTRAAYNLPTRLNNLYESTKDAFDTAQDPKAPQELRQQAATYNRFVDNLSALPTEFRNGEVFIADIPASDALTSRKFVIKEPERPVIEQLAGTFKNADNFVTDFDGNKEYNENAVRQAFRQRLKHGFPEAEALLIETLASRMGTTTDRLNQDVIAEDLSDPEILKAAEDAVVDYLRPEVRSVTRTGESRAGGRESLLARATRLSKDGENYGIQFPSEKLKISAPASTFPKTIAQFLVAESGDEVEYKNNPESFNVKASVENVVVLPSGELAVLFKGLRQSGTDVFSGGQSGGLVSNDVGFLVGVAGEQAHNYITISQYPQLQNSLAASLGLEEASQLPQAISERIGGGSFSQGENQQEDVDVISLTDLKEDYDFGDMSDKDIIDFYEEQGYKVQ